MILHIVPDDKFIDMAYNMFEKASPDNNEFMVVGKHEKFKYIKTTPITKITPFKFISKGFAKNLTQYEFVVIHWLDEMKKQLIMNAPKDVKFLWIGWGGDYYKYVDKNLYLPFTQKLVDEMLVVADNVGLKLKIKNFIKQKFFLSDAQDIGKILNRINYFAPVLKEDYYLVEKSFENYHSKYLDWNYGALEDDLIKDNDAIVSGNNILVGNSATAENNHLDSFQLLQNLELEDRKIICPLSYGDLEYGKIVEKRAKELFGNKVETLTTFMPIDEYNKIISSCSIVVMNHLRQQAVGNIVIMLYLGAKVFLNKENTVYDFFKNNGAIVFAMEELNNENINLRLNEMEVKTNRDVLRKYWSRDVMIEKTKNLIEAMRNENA